MYAPYNLTSLEHRRASQQRQVESRGDEQGRQHGRLPRVPSFSISLAIAFRARKKWTCNLLSAQPRAYSAKGRTPEHRAREAQRAACRSAAGRRSRPPRAAASAESEGPSSPLTRRERACVGVGRCLTAPDCALYSFWWDGRRRASLPSPVCGRAGWILLFLAISTFVPSPSCVRVQHVARP